MIKRVRIKEFEKGLLFVHGEFKKLLNKGVHWIPNFNLAKKVHVVSQRNPYLVHGDVDLIARSGLLQDHATVLDIKDNERALYWKDGRFECILGPGIHLIWNKPFEINIELVDTTVGVFKHKHLDTITGKVGTGHFLDLFPVEEGHVGLFFLNGEHIETLKPGQYAFWKDSARVAVYKKDIREKVLDIPGQEIMTADKVTLRINAVVSYTIKDALKAILSSENAGQALYREAQLALRGVIGSHELDNVLRNKDKIAKELELTVAKKTASFGLEVKGLGIRDIILPGEMKEILNKVTEAKKAAEANLIVRREETAAMRSQANTARMLVNNPTLMRLKELEVLEKVAGSTNFSVILDDKKLTDRVVNIL